ncbi:hypothetical protein HMPREF9682_01714 [Streptococcus intermedius F0395]|nr:hypothetical protein HMPREF9682_01714 [Streptococcus intermedius F0395]
MQEYYGRRTLVIYQNVVRRDILKEKVGPDNLSISLTATIARYGYERDLLVIVEGFYETDIYGQMLEELRDLFYPKVLSYYYDLTFEEAVRHHQTRSKKADFSPADMKRWWKECDFLGWEEAIFTDQVSLEDAFQKISKNINLL